VCDTPIMATDCGHIYNDETIMKTWLAALGKRDYFHPGIVVRHSPIAGFGLFASTLIKAGELISYEDINDYAVLNRAAIESMSPADQDTWWHFSYQVGDDAWFGPRTRDVIQHKPTFFENHSCDPSTWFVDDVTMTARRDIQPGDEITYDYSTTESVIDPEMDAVVCRCGTALCRGRFLSSDWERTELQTRYAGHWMSYLEAKVLRTRGHYDEALRIEARSRRVLGVATDDEEPLSPPGEAQAALCLAGREGLRERSDATTESASTSSSDDDEQWQGQGVGTGRGGVRGADSHAHSVRVASH